MGEGGVAKALPVWCLWMAIFNSLHFPLDDKGHHFGPLREGFILATGLRCLFTSISGHFDPLLLCFFERSFHCDAEIKEGSFHLLHGKIQICQGNIGFTAPAIQATVHWTSTARICNRLSVYPS
jgi:hypothetical protein